jgi:hypothetical protein
MADNLCLQCGLCCNGAIFRKVEIQPGDDPKALTRLGLKIHRGGRASYFTQCCSAFACGKCAIYNSRPAHCRLFECLVLKRLNSGGLTRKQALRLVKKAVRITARVTSLIESLGNHENKASLQERYEATLSTDSSRLTRERIVALGHLTVAMHELNMLLSKEFYDGLDSV